MQGSCKPQNWVRFLVEAPETTMSPQSYGEQTCRVPLTPVSHNLDYTIRKSCADLIDLLDHERLNAKTQEQIRAYDYAIAQIETAQMWAIKAFYISY